MNSINPVKHSATVLALLAMLAVQLPAASATAQNQENARVQTEQTLSLGQQAIGPIAAWMAVGDMDQLRPALEQGLDAGLAISD